MKNILLVPIIILATFLRLNNSIDFIPAIFGIVAILFTYLLVTKLFKEEKTALLSAFFLSISPWHIHFSRNSWEINLTLTLLLIAIYLFFISGKNRKFTFFAIILLILVSWLHISLSFSQNLALDNVYLNKELVVRYFNHFSGRFMFFEGDWQNIENSSPNVGYLLLADLPLLISGLYFLFRKKDKASMFVLLWLLLAPLFSVFAQDDVNGALSFNMVIPLTIVVASGFRFLLLKVSSLNVFVKCLILVVWLSLYFSNYMYYLDSYYVHDKVMGINTDL